MQKAIVACGSPRPAAFRCPAGAAHLHYSNSALLAPPHHQLPAFPALPPTANLEAARTGIAPPSPLRTRPTCAHSPLFTEYLPSLAARRRHRHTQTRQTGEARTRCPVATVGAMPAEEEKERKRKKRRRIPVWEEPLLLVLACFENVLSHRLTTSDDSPADAH